MVRTRRRTDALTAHALLGDITSGILMLLAVGTIVQATSAVCGSFFGPRHNVTEFDPAQPSQYFNYGFKDLAMLFAYTLVWITVHAIWQEYVLDKLYKKLHLSKAKNAKFFESGQLVLFYVISVAWAIMLFNNEGYFQSGLSYLWRDYPYTGMTTWTKLYFILQLSYWLHNYPELFLQKVRKEDIPSRLVYTTLYLTVILYAYLTRFWRVAIVLLTVHYLIETFFHLSRLAYFYMTTKTHSASAKSTSASLFKIWNSLFIFGRLTSVVLIWLTFWFGLRSSSINKISFSSTPSGAAADSNAAAQQPLLVSNFNTPTVRLFTLVVSGALQFWMVWNFIQVCARAASNTSLHLSLGLVPHEAPS